MASTIGRAFVKSFEKQVERFPKGFNGIGSLESLPHVSLNSNGEGKVELSYSKKRGLGVLGLRNTISFSLSPGLEDNSGSELSIRREKERILDFIDPNGTPAETWTISSESLGGMSLWATCRNWWNLEGAVNVALQLHPTATDQKS